jgi:hypothetical protein
LKHLTQEQYDALVGGDITAIKSEAQLQAAAQRLVDRAWALGLVLTVEQRPLQPLAMGYHETVVSVREARR